jgi:transcriptional regulator with XRE-family HTH domain
MSPPHRSRPLDAIDLRVALRLRNRRRELQVDPAILDIVIGEPAGTVARFEAAERRIPASILFRLGEALNVDVPYFFVEEAGGGVAEDVIERAGKAAGPPQIEPQMIAEGERLTRMFRRVPSQNLRRLVIRLIKSIAAREQSRK